MAGGVRRTERDLIGNYGSAGCSCVRSYYDAAIKDTADNGCACAGSFREGDSSRVKSEVAVVVGEVEARHGGRGRSAADLYIGASSDDYYSVLFLDFSKVGSLK